MHIQILNNYENGIIKLICGLNSFFLSIIYQLITTEIVSYNESWAFFKKTTTKRQRRKKGRSHAEIIYPTASASKAFTNLQYFPETSSFWNFTLLFHFKFDVLKECSIIQRQNYIYWVCVFIAEQPVRMFFLTGCCLLAWCVEVFNYPSSTWSPHFTFCHTSSALTSNVGIWHVYKKHKIIH